MRDFAFYYQNVRGLRTKTDDLFTSILNCSYDFIVLTETWLNESVNDGELFSNNYVVFRKDRNYSVTGQTRGGGVLIAVNKNIKCQICYDLILNGYECLWGKFYVENVIYYLASIYFPLNSPSQFVSNYFDFLESRVELLGSNCIVMGDFNLPFINLNNCQFDGGPVVRRLNK